MRFINVAVLCNNLKVNLALSVGAVLMLSLNAGETVSVKLFG